MGDLLNKIMVVDNEKIEFSPEIQRRMEKAFDEAVSKSNEFAFLDGIEIVMDTMIKMDLNTTRKLVEERLVEDGVIEIADPEGKQNVDEGLSFAEIVAGQIG